MLDRRATALLRPALERIARLLVRAGVGPNQVTLAGFLVGTLAAGLIVAGMNQLALAAILASRLCDGLDGAVARVGGTVSDRGGFLDIALDFVFYASIPLAFALADPQPNALGAAVLLAAFIGTGSSFLAFAALAAKRGLHSTDYPHKSFYFLGGLTESGETLLCFCAMCLWSAWFAWFAYGFAVLCLLTTGTRIWWGWRALGEPDPRH